MRTKIWISQLVFFEANSDQAHFGESFIVKYSAAPICGPEVITDMDPLIEDIGCEVVHAIFAVLFVYLRVDQHDAGARGVFDLDFSLGTS